MENSKSASVPDQQDSLTALIDDLITPGTINVPESIPVEPPTEPATEPSPPPLQPPSSLPIEVQATQQIKIPDKKDIIRDDPLIKGILNEDGVFDLLDVVLAELAEESASLKYERIKKELKDEPTDRLSLRRSNILKMISDALVQKRNLALNDFINLRSPQWQIVFDQLMKRVRKTLMDLQYSSEELELFFQKLQFNLEGFEEMTEIKLKESLSRSD